MSSDSDSGSDSPLSSAETSPHASRINDEPEEVDYLHQFAWNLEHDKASFIDQITTYWAECVILSLIIRAFYFALFIIVLRLRSLFHLRKLHIIDNK